MPTTIHYRAVAERSVMPRALGNSLGVATLTTLVALALGLPAAYAIARLPVPGKAVLLLVIVASTAFPQIATVSPLYLLMRALGLRDTWTALVLANASFALPLVIWLLAGFIREIPRRLEEAASLDGAGASSCSRWIIVPLVAPGMASAALLTFLASLERVPLRLHVHGHGGQPHRAGRAGAVPRASSRCRGATSRRRPSWRACRRS